MKTRLSQWLMVFILFFSFLSCKKELSKEDGEIPVNGNFYATIDGKQWKADSLQLIFESGGGVSINGLSKTGEQISIVLPAFKTGSYTLNAGSEAYAYYTDILILPPVGYLSNTGTAGGTVTISSIDTVHHLISGSFSFVLINPADNSSKTITQGIIQNVPYIGTAVVINPPPTDGNGLDTLNAMVDGVLFVGKRVESQQNSVYPNELLIVGSSEDGTQRLEIIMPLNVTPGTYNLDYATSLYIGIYAPLVSETLISQANGTLTVISNDAVNGRIKGTFMFIATPVYGVTSPATLTDGYFSVNY